MCSKGKWVIVRTVPCAILKQLRKSFYFAILTAPQLLYSQGKVCVFIKLRSQFLKVFEHWSFYETGLFCLVGLAHPSTFYKLGPRHFQFLQVSECLCKQGLKCLASSVLLRAEAQEVSGVPAHGGCCGCLSTDALEPSWKLTEVDGKNLFNLVSVLFSLWACQACSCHFILCFCSSGHRETVFHWSLGTVTAICS